MIRSMTGFGRGHYEGNGYRITCEAKGVNHRYLEIQFRMPRKYHTLEDRIKEVVKQIFNRGRVELSISIEKMGLPNHSIKLDKEIAMIYYNKLNELADYLNISHDIRLIDLFRLPEVFNMEDQEDDIEILWDVLEKALVEALEMKNMMRLREGANLSKDIKYRNRVIFELVEKLEKKSPEVAAEHLKKIKRRIEEVILTDIVDEQRILLEAAVFAEKSNITEEIVRLFSHIEFLDELMEQDEPVGRKCDFLLQEMFREINTIGSKASDLDMNRIVVDVKSELEKIREQVQNIE